MKRGILIQLLVITIGMVILNLGHIGFIWQNEQYQNEFARQPMLVYSCSYEKLKLLRDDLNELPYVSYINIEADTLVARSLIETYELAHAEDILSNYQLPSIMTIYFFGEKFAKTNQLDMYDLIYKKYDISNIIFNDKEVAHIKELMDNLHFIYQIIYIIYLSLFLLLMLLMRNFFERREDRYWEIYHRSGGKAGGRTKQYIWDSFLLLILPAVFVAGLYLAALYFGYLTYHINFYHFYIQAGLVIFNSILARLFLGRKF